MFMPGQVLPEALKEAILAALSDSKIKAELAKQIRAEIDARQPGHSVGGQTYHSLTAGDVNMQVRMAASGYDVFGRTVMTHKSEFNNKNSYKKMKNQIKYGKSPQKQFRNRGSRDIV